MELLMGSGETYDFLATKLNTEYPGELLQVSPTYKGPTFDGSDMYWYPFKDEVDELRFRLNNLEHVRDITFERAYLCIPNIPQQDHDNILGSTSVWKLFEDYLIRYAHLIHDLQLKNCVVHIINELVPAEDNFGAETFCNVIRTVIMTALKGTNATLKYYSHTSLGGKSLEDFWNTDWNWRVLK